MTQRSGRFEHGLMEAQRTYPSLPQQSPACFSCSKQRCTPNSITTTTRVPLTPPPIIACQDACSSLCSFREPLVGLFLHTHNISGEFTSSASTCLWRFVRPQNQTVHAYECAISAALAGNTAWPGCISAGERDVANIRVSGACARACRQ